MKRRNRGARLAEAARRRKKYRRLLKRYRLHIIAGAAVLAVIALLCTAAVMESGSGAEETEKKQEDTLQKGKTAKEDIRTTETVKQETSADKQNPFDTMSKDWSWEDLQGFQPYTVPQEYQKEGGAFPEEMQKYTYIICKQAGIDYVVVLAMIEIESGYRWDAIGAGDDVGYMQVVQRWHEDRMERLGADNLLDPFQNVRVGVDFMKELLEKYEGSYEKALTAYQYGSSGAYKYVFSAGLNCSKYAENVLKVADRIRTEMEMNED